MEPTRRSSLAMMAAACLAAPAYAQTATLEARAVGLVQTFLARVIGAPVADRRRFATAALDGVNALDAGTALLEVAAVGVLVRASDLEDAVRAGYPRRSREALALALRTLPNTAWTHALQGAWHYEIVRRSALGATLYGASLKRGDEAFTRAMASAGSDAGVRLSYAIALLSDDPEARRARALEVLGPATSPLSGAYGAKVETHTSELRKLLSSHSPAQAERYVLSIF